MRRDPLEGVLAPRDVRQIVAAAEHAHAEMEERVAGRVDEIVPRAVFLKMEEAGLLQAELPPRALHAAEGVQTDARAREASGEVKRTVELLFGGDVRLQLRFVRDLSGKVARRLSELVEQFLPSPRRDERVRHLPFLRLRRQEDAVLERVPVPLAVVLHLEVSTHGEAERQRLAVDVLHGDFASVALEQLLVQPQRERECPFLVVHAPRTALDEARRHEHGEKHLV